jgi:hypothetical protein
MNRLRLTVLGTFLAVGLAGCAGLDRPNWSHPGSVTEQQTRAQRFDPYPENEPGPKITGARPREYEKPIPEVDRARWPQTSGVLRAGWLPWNWGRTQ